MLKNLRDLLKVMGKYSSWYLTSTLLLFVSIIARSLEPKVLQITVDHVLLFFTKQVIQEEQQLDFVTRFLQSFLPLLHPENLTWVLLSLCLMYMVISMVRGTFLFTSVTLKDASTERITKALRDRVFLHIQRMPMSFFSGISRGELIQRSTGDIDTVKRFMHHQVVAVLRLSATFFFSFSMMWLMDWRYALLSVVLAPIIFYAGFRFFSMERRVWKEHEKEADRLNNMVQENLNGIRVVTAYSNQDFEMERFDQQNQRKRKMGLKQAGLHAIFWPVTDFLVHLQLVISVLGGGYFALNGYITVGELLGFYTYIGMVTYPMRQLGKVLSNMGMAIVAMGRISEILEHPSEEDEGNYEPELFKGEIEFKGVSFRYHPQDAEPALDHVSFKVNAGERLAVTGPSGAGKSTVIKLLLRLYEPDEGEILLDGVPIQAYPKIYLRSKIGVAMQKAFLFSKTINQNIAYTQDKVVELDVDEAAKIAEAYEMKHAFPLGFQTMVGEKGVTLSGGQKQRVALARTVITWPEIVVLDDTTSAVDTLTELNILKALDEALNKRTALVIAHRVASISRCDRLLVLEKGRVTQWGDPEVLKDQAGYYQQILMIQTQDSLDGHTLSPSLR